MNFYYNMLIFWEGPVIMTEMLSVITVFWPVTAIFILFYLFYSMSTILAMSILFVSFLFCLFLRVRIVLFFKDKLHSLKDNIKQQEIHSTWGEIYHIHTLISMVLWGAINSPGSTNKALTWPAQDPWKEINVFVLEEVRWCGTVNNSLSQTGLLHRCLIFWLLKHAQCIVLDHNKVVNVPVCLLSSLSVWTKVLDSLGMSDNAAVVFHSQAMLVFCFEVSSNNE